RLMRHLRPKHLTGRVLPATNHQQPTTNNQPPLPIECLGSTFRRPRPKRTNARRKLQRMTTRQSSTPFTASAIFFALALAAQIPLAAATCESLSSLSIPHTTITLAQSVAAGEFTLPAGTPAP